MRSSASGSRGLRQVVQIAGKEFGTRFRTGWVLACAIVWLGAIGLTSFYGLAQVGRLGLQGYERTVVSLLNVVQYLVPLLGLLVGHDLVVGEREERTLSLLVASGVARSHLLWGKFLGGCMTLVFPLVLGFTVAGTAIGLAAKDPAVRPFLVLATSGLVLGITFLGLGLAISTWCRSRVQALVVALVAWCLAIFAFDLVAVGIVLSTQAPAAAREVEAACDPMHVNVGADLHAEYDVGSPAPGQSVARPEQAHLEWIFLNPVDLFRAVNLSDQTRLTLPTTLVLLIFGLWIGLSFSTSLWKFYRLDL